MFNIQTWSRREIDISLLNFSFTTKDVSLVTATTAFPKVPLHFCIIIYEYFLLKVLLDTRKWSFWYRFPEAKWLYSCSKCVKYVVYFHVSFLIDTQTGFSFHCTDFENQGAHSNEFVSQPLHNSVCCADEPTLDSHPTLLLLRDFNYSIPNRWGKYGPLIRPVMCFYFENSSSRYIEKPGSMSSYNRKRFFAISATELVVMCTFPSHCRNAVVQPRWKK